MIKEGQVYVYELKEGYSVKREIIKVFWNSAWYYYEEYTKDFGVVDKGVKEFNIEDPIEELGKLVLDSEIKEQIGDVSKSIIEAISLLKSVFEKDNSIAWVWHCMLAVSKMDDGVPHEKANYRAADLMYKLFDFDMTKVPEFIEVMRKYEEAK